MQSRTTLADLSRAITAGIESGGLPGLLQTLGRMIGDHQPSFECVVGFDNDLASAGTAEQVWDAALDFAKCLREAVLDPEPPEPPEPPPEEPDPDARPPGRRPETLADVVLATLLVRLR